MKKTVIFLVLLFSYSASLLAQTPQNTEARQKLIDTLQKIYKKPAYERLHLIRSLYQKNMKPDLADNLKQILIFEQIDHNLMFRNYDTMQVYYKELAKIETKYKPNISNLEFERIDAQEWILSQADSQQAIFFNEAHQSSHHRYFVYQNLQKLYDKGFRYLAIEWMYDSLVNEKAYPIYEKNIPYINEIVAGELRREAKRIGYTLIPYDHSNTPDSSFVDYDIKVANSLDQREWNQAINLKKQVFDKDSKAKLVLLGGYDHISETASGTWNPMASYFKQITHINPLTIYQAHDDGWDKATYRAMYDTNVSEDLKGKVIAFKQTNEHIWTTRNVDMMVFHPDYYAKSEPDFLYFGGKRKKVKINTKGVKKHQLLAVQAHLIEEGTDALFLDQVEINVSKKADYYLFLGKGKYKISFMNQEGKIVRKYIQKVNE